MDRLSSDIFMYCLLPEVTSGSDVTSLARTCKYLRRLINRYLREDLCRVNKYHLAHIEDVYRYPWIWPDLHDRMRTFFILTIYSMLPYTSYPEIVSVIDDRHDYDYELLNLDITMEPPFFQIKMDGRVWISDRWRTYWNIIYHMRFDGGIPCLEYTLSGCDYTDKGVFDDLEEYIRLFFQVFSRYRNVIFPS